LTTPSDARIAPPRARAARTHMIEMSTRALEPIYI
jgi:hypothetical protein